MTFWRVVHAIGWVTLHEILRQKVLYNVLMIAFLIFGLGLLATQLTFTQPERMVLDLGYAAITLSSLLLATLIGANLLNREAERRTDQVMLSHPISTFDYVFGKYWGLVQVLILNWALLIVVQGLLLFAQNHSFFETRSIPNFFAALGLSLIQSCALGAIAMTFASISTPSLSVILSTGIYLIGIHHSDLLLLATRTESWFWASWIRTIAAVIPNFEFFNIGLSLTYDLPISLQFLVMGVGYGILLIMACLLMTSRMIYQFMR